MSAHSRTQARFTACARSVQSSRCDNTPRAAAWRPQSGMYYNRNYKTCVHARNCCSPFQLGAVDELPRAPADQLTDAQHGFWYARLSWKWSKKRGLSQLVIKRPLYFDVKRYDNQNIHTKYKTPRPTESDALGTTTRNGLNGSPPPICVCDHRWDSVPRSGLQMMFL